MSSPARKPAPLLREVYGGLLRRARWAQGRTLSDVAAAAGISMPYLSEVERGRKEPSSEVLEAVCIALGSDVAELVGAAHRDLTASRAPAPLLHLRSVPDEPGEGMPVAARAATPTLLAA